MKPRKPGRPPLWRSHLLALTLTLLIAGVAGSVFGEAGSPGEATFPEPCGQWHRGAGATDPLDLAAVRRAYRDVKARFDRAVAKAPANLDDLLEQPHRTGFPACRGRAHREIPLNTKRVPGLKGQVYYFASPDSRGRLHLASEVRRKNPDAVFILDLAKISQLGQVARSTTKPTYLASRRLAEALGVRCSGTLVRISENGDAVRIDEGL